MFASKTDYFAQHAQIPDYFRKLFYSTGELFPNLALNLGGGQNIFYLSYYGLYSPIVLISYLFPNIPMIICLQISNIIMFFITICLMYAFLKKHFNDKRVVIISNILFILSGSLFFHFHRHFMFVNYMPFLILGLFGVDKYFKSNKKTLLIVSTFLMILSSYFYSIIGIFILVLYAISCYIKKENKISAKEFLKVGFKFLIPIFIGIFMSLFLLIPTFYAVSGRESGTNSISLLSLIIPKQNLDSILYGTYTMGLTSFSLFALAHNCIKGKRKTKLLSIVIAIVITIPIFIYLLNGGLYVRNKVFITFLPIMTYLIAVFINDLFKNKVKIIPLFKFGLLLFPIAIITGYHYFYFYIDLSVTLISLYLYYKYKNPKIIIIPAIIIALITFIISNVTETYITTDEYENTYNKNEAKLIKDTLKNETSIVRSNNLNSTLYTINHIFVPNYYQTSLYSSTYNNNYYNFYKNEFKQTFTYRNKLITSQNKNILYDLFMGTKYVISKKKPSIGYKKVSKIDNVTIYKNEDVLPIIYSTNRTFKKDVYETLKYPFNVEVMIENVITNNGSYNIPRLNTREISLDYKLNKINNKDISIRKTEEGYYVKVKEKTSVVLTLDEPIKDDILITEFKINNLQNCSIGDQAITINSIKNKQTCKQWEYQNSNDIFHYVISDNKQFKNLTITFEKGTYDIRNIKTYLLNYNSVIEKTKTVDKFIFDKSNTKADTIIGTIDVTNDGYLVTSIPYDKGFKIKVDNNYIDYEKVNTSFIGFKINKGFHEIKIIYEAPGFKEGILISGIFTGIFIVIAFKEWEKKRFNN